MRAWGGALAAAAAAALLAGARVAAEDAIATYEYMFKGQVDDMVWLGSRRENVFVQTSEHEVHRSFDEGKTFEGVRPLLVGMQTPQVPLDLEVKQMVTHDNFPDLLLLVSRGTMQYLSKDGGRSFTAFRTPSPVEEIVFHPRRPDCLLVSGLTKACPSVQSLKLSSENKHRSDKDWKGNTACFKVLYGSEDSGATFRHLADYVVQFDWFQRLYEETGTADADFASLKESATSSLDVLVSKPHNQLRDQVFGIWNPDINLHRGVDMFRGGHKLLVKGGNRFLFTKDFLFVAQVIDKGRNEVRLQLSKDKTKTFYSGTLPFNLAEHSYTVLDASEGVIFLHVNHAGDASRYGHVYVSDSTGMNYSFSLRDNMRDASGKCDFDKVQSIEGVYTANIVQNVEELEEAAKAGSSRGGRDRRSRISPRVRSVISFDRGGEWALLRPPLEDSKGNKIECAVAQTCSLHLHGHTSRSPPIYSSEKSVGLLMGVGNVGASLAERAAELNTYMSRDAGLTWTEVLKGSHIYEIGDHGGLVVAAPDLSKTKSLSYTWTQGKDWVDIDFTREPLDVDNIIIEPSSTSRVFHVYGTRDGVNGAIITVDFSGLHERECVGAAVPQSPESDYEVWSPRDTPNSPGGFGTACHLGRTMEYTRRKQEAACYNPNKFEATRFVRNCECTERDYECDFGFKRQVVHGPCLRDARIDNSTLAPPRTCPASGRYTVSNGYRLVGGNSCVGGKDLGPTTYTCSRGFLGVSLSGWFVLLVLGGLFGAMLHNSSGLDARRSFDTFGHSDFGDGTASCWEMVRELSTSPEERSKFFSRLRGGHQASGAPETAMDFGDDDEFVETGGDFDFDDDDLAEDGHAEELIAATTMAGPLPPAPAKAPEAVPKLSAPPTSAPIDLFGDEDGGDAV